MHASDFILYGSFHPLAVFDFGSMLSRDLEFDAERYLVALLVHLVLNGELRSAIVPHKHDRDNSG